MTTENLSAVPAVVNNKSENSVSACAETLGDGVPGGVAHNGLGARAGTALSTPVLLHGSSNSVVQVQAEKSDSPFSIDWLRWSAPGMTVKQLAALRKELAWLGPLPDEKRLLGYEGCTVAGFGFLGMRLVGGKYDLVLDLSGEALRFLRHTHDDVTILRQLMSVGIPGGYGDGENVTGWGHFTRLDVARDIVGSSIDLDVWHEACRQHQRYLQGELESSPIACRARGNLARKKYFFSAVSPMNTETIYVGSRTSARFLRIYNKTLGETRKGVGDDGTIVLQNWLRAELQFNAQGQKDERTGSRVVAAQVAAEMIARQGLACIPSLINGFFSMPDDAEWKKWMGEEKQTLGLPGRPESTPERRLRWILSKASGIVGMLSYLWAVGVGDKIEDAIVMFKQDKHVLETYIRALVKSAESSRGVVSPCPG